MVIIFFFFKEAVWYSLDIMYIKLVKSAEMSSLSYVAENMIFYPFWSSSYCNS